ncbi:unnamed protein product [Phyllotreta striolata]|uniref:Uncharacterized protein n=1 Tax=Phyllotreta striolata TaxID=444603 RepID=A0A9N9TZ22_PHYSR|nr:unnamed protein product [Phyllotreta striolata]
MHSPAFDQRRFQRCICNRQKYHALTQTFNIHRESGSHSALRPVQKFRNTPIRYKNPTIQPDQHQSSDINQTMPFKLLVIAAALACANAGFIGAPVAYSAAPDVSGAYIHHAPVAYAAPQVAVHAPAYGSTHQSVERSLGGAQSVSHYSKAIDSAFSSVRKYDTRITNDALTYAPAPAVTYSSGPLLAKAVAPAVTYSSGPLLAKAVAPAVAYSSGPLLAKAVAPAVAYSSGPLLAKAVAPAVAYSSGPLLAKAVAPAVAYPSGPLLAKAVAPAVAYSPATVVAHTSFSGFGTAYEW